MSEKHKSHHLVQSE